MTPRRHLIVVFAVALLLAPSLLWGASPAALRVMWWGDQTRADITGKKVLLPEQEDSDLVGNACVGFYGVEEFESPTEAAESLVRFRKTFHPDPGARQIYDELFAVFAKACSGLGDLFRGLPPRP